MVAALIRAKPIGTKCNLYREGLTPFTFFPHHSKNRKNMIGMGREVKRLTGDSALWRVCVKLAAPHSTQGELYHNLWLQTKHTGPNKDTSVPTLNLCTQTAHG